VPKLFHQPNISVFSDPKILPHEFFYLTSSKFNFYCRNFTFNFLNQNFHTNFISIFFTFPQKTNSFSVATAEACPFSGIGPYRTANASLDSTFLALHCGSQHAPGSDEAAIFWAFLVAILWI
jgi:hypothetical protein